MDDNDRSISEVIDVNTERIQNLIYVIRDKQVMIDSDLAMLYNVETKRLNESVKRNIDRFPSHFRFQLSEEEESSLRSQFATSKLAEGKAEEGIYPMHIQNRELPCYRLC